MEKGDHRFTPENDQVIDCMRGWVGSKAGL